jgi:hypothetical protein
MVTISTFAITFIAISIIGYRELVRTKLELSGHPELKEGEPAEIEITEDIAVALSDVVKTKCRFDHAHKHRSETDDMWKLGKSMDASVANLVKLMVNKDNPTEEAKPKSNIIEYDFR